MVGKNKKKKTKNVHLTSIHSKIGLGGIGKFNNSRVNNTSSMKELYESARDFVNVAEPVIEVPPYLEDPPPLEPEQDTREQRRRSSALREDVGPSSSRARRRHSSAMQEDVGPSLSTPYTQPAYDLGQQYGSSMSTPYTQPAYDLGQQYGTSMSTPYTQPAYDVSTSLGLQYGTSMSIPYTQPTYSIAGNDVSTSIELQYETPQHTEDDMLMQSGSFFTNLLNTPFIDYNAYAHYASQHPNFNSSPIPFAGTSENREPSAREESSQQNQNERILPRRSTRQIHPPNCGTGGHKGHLP